jgi:hypothetical protein
MIPTADTVVILAFPDAPASNRPPSAQGGVLEKLERVARYKRNPRSPEYMRRLAASMLPTATVVEVDGALPRAAISQARHVVLLWPDAIGYAWSRLEREVFKYKRPDAHVYALSGRGRTFKLTMGTLFSVRLRRLAERVWLGEAVMAVGLLVSAPFLVVWDFARGHR